MCVRKLHIIYVSKYSQKFYLIIYAHLYFYKGCKAERFLISSIKFKGYNFNKFWFLCFANHIDFTIITISHIFKK